MLKIQENKIPDNLKEILFFQEKELIGASKQIIHLVQEKNKEILKLRKKAHYDHLTGLLNRHGLEYKIKKYFQNGEHISLISIDIEKLKVINDYYGSNSGDEAIKNTAYILKKYLKTNEKDLICRWGGDEFIIIIKKIQLDLLEKKIKEILTQVEKINKKNLENNKYPYSLHIGVINNHIIDNFQIATEEGFKKAKEKLKEV